LFSRIGSIMIKGFALGDPAGPGEFGFVAEQIGTVKIETVSYKLPGTSGPASLPIGPTGDLALRRI
jgi:hypothetical protein